MTVINKNNKHKMPSCNNKDIEKILNKVKELSPSERKKAEKFITEITPKGMCELLHSIRRWYSYWTGGHARRILKYHKYLQKIMDLSLPKGVYRGFKIFNDNKLAQHKIGDVINLKIIRNGECASFTGKREIANRFSGKTKDKTGLVVQLLNAKNYKVFIVPPEKTEKWFNHLYELTMGKSFRHNEQEYVICAKQIKVRIIDVKK